MNTNNIDKLREEAAAAAGEVAYMLEPFDPASDSEMIRNMHKALCEMVRCGARMAYADFVEQVQAEDQKFIKKLEGMHLRYTDEYCETGSKYYEGYADALDEVLKIFKEM